MNARLGITPRLLFRLPNELTLGIERVAREPPNSSFPGGTQGRPATGLLRAHGCLGPLPAGEVLKCIGHVHVCAKWAPTESLSCVTLNQPKQLSHLSRLDDPFLSVISGTAS